MPPLEYLDLEDYAVLWEATGRNDDNGNPVVSDTPVEIRCRWEEGNIESPAPQTQDLVVDAVIATGRQLPMGSILWEGRLADVATATRDLYEVINRSRAKDLRGRISRYEFGLKRYTDTLPTG